MHFNWSLLWPFVAMLVVGLLFGKSRVRVEFQMIGIVALAFVYAIWVYYSNKIKFAGLFEPETASYISRVFAFFLVGVVGAVITEQFYPKKT